MICSFMDSCSKHGPEGKYLQVPSLGVVFSSTQDTKNISCREELGLAVAFDVDKLCWYLKVHLCLSGLLDELFIGIFS